MKKLFKNCLCIITFFALCLVVMLSAGFNAGNSHTANAASNASISSFFEHINLSSEGMVYGAENFANDDYTNFMFGENNTSNTYTYIGALYTNSNITLYPSDKLNNYILNDNNATFSILTSTTYENFDNTSGKFHTTSVNNKMLQLHDDNSDSKIDYAVFKMNYGNPLIQRFEIKYSYTINIFGTDGISISKEKIEAVYVLIIIQQDLNFTRYNPITYTYTDDNGIKQDVYEMETGNIYKTNVDLKIPEGTPVNPIYINFIHNGVNYRIYNIYGEFYNDFGSTAITYQTNDSPIDLTDSTLPLNQNGIFEITIYDRASTFVGKNTELKLNNPNANIQTDSFMVNIDPESVYLTAESESGIQIADSHRTTEDVVVTLYNVTTNNVESITFTKTKPDSSSSTQDYYYYRDYIAKKFPTKFDLNEDYIYSFTIVYKDRTIEPYTYQIFVIKNVQPSYTTASGERLLPTGTNEIQPVTITEEVKQEYGNGIKCNYTYDYTIELANSVPTISGIDNNGTIDGTVNLTIYGVGYIKVTISVGGSISEIKTVNSGDQITLSSAGDYRVEIQDEMSGQTFKNFTIGVKMNTATIALIAVGVLLIAAVVLFILRNRGRVSVK